MCAKVTEVEHALEDVKQLLSGSDVIAHAVRSTSTTEGAQPEKAKSKSWEHEWVAIVQDLVEKDAGWKYVLNHLMARTTVVHAHPCTVG